MTSLAHTSTATEGPFSISVAGDDANTGASRDFARAAVSATVRRIIG